MMSVKATQWLRCKDSRDYLARCSTSSRDSCLTAHRDRACPSLSIAPTGPIVEPWPREASHPLPQLDADSGYRGPVACRAAGITYRQLDYWARTGLVEPSIRSAKGSGSQRLYSFRDILVLKVVKRLLDTGVSLQQIRTAVSALHSRGVEDLASITLMSDGASVYECTSADEVVDLVAGGQGVFGIAVGRVWHEVEGALADLPVDHAQALGTPLVEDELAKRRAAKRQQAI